MSPDWPADPGPRPRANVSVPSAPAVLADRGRFAFARWTVRGRFRRRRFARVGFRDGRFVLVVVREDFLTPLRAALVFTRRAELAFDVRFFPRGALRRRLGGFLAMAALYISEGRPEGR